MKHGTNFGLRVTHEKLLRKTKPTTSVLFQNCILIKRGNLIQSSIFENTCIMLKYVIKK